MAKVTFLYGDGTEKQIETMAGNNLLEVARGANVVIDAPCSGNGGCGKCKVRYISGELHYQKTLHISDEDYADGWRLACRSTIEGDVTVEVPDIASAYKSRMKIADLDSKEEIAIFENSRKGLEDAGIIMENNMEVISVKMDIPTLDDTMPDNERMLRALKAVYGDKEIILPYYVLVKMPETLREHDFSIQCIVGKSEHRIYVYDILGAGQKAVIGGLAVDIGTTSVAALLLDMQTGEILAKASTGNGQIRFGADVINRIIESAKEGGKKKLQDAIVKETLNPLIQEMCRKAGLDVNQVYRMSVASNTTMNHLLTGVSADPLRMEPYIPAFFKTNSIFASDLGIMVHPGAHLIVAPNVGSYVGGDITAGVLASGLWNRSEFSLFIDLGTNGELVFGNEEFMMCCACSAGPAFEGGDISCGMRATDGAIEVCSIDDETLEPEYKVVGDEGQKPLGLCGSGIIDVISELFRTGIINPKGKFQKEGKRIRYDEYGVGSYVLAFQEESAGGTDVAITEVDIDSFIRAKGAIFSAIRTMLVSLGSDISMIERVYVAGGIGSGINMKNAVRIGMFPDIPIDKYQYIGNSSLAGAYSILFSTPAERKTYELSRNMTYLELSNVPGYMDEFIACCFLPHTDAALFSSFV